MNVRATIRVIRRDHERAQIHAVDENGFSYKIEVPADAVALVTEGHLVLSFSVEIPKPPPPAIPGFDPLPKPNGNPTPREPTPASASGDFEALMAQIRPPATSTLSASQRLARDLGLTFDNS